jgi:hypothetical protein
VALHPEVALRPGIAVAVHAVTAVPVLGDKVGFYEHKKRANPYRFARFAFMPLSLF